MKIKKISLSILLLVVMVSALVLGVACEKPITKIELKNTEYWGPASSDAEETNMIKATKSGNDLVINYTEKKEWTGIAYTLNYHEPEVLKTMKTLVIKAKMTSDNVVNPSMMFKMDVLAKEVSVKGTTTETTYEWDVSEMDLSTETWFIIFPDAGVAGSTGTITISEIYLTVDEENADNDVSKSPVTNLITPNPVTPNWQEVKADALTIGGWVDASGYDVYDVKAEGDGYKVNVNKRIGTGAWSALISYVHGETSVFQTLKSFKIKVKGTAGQAILVKPFDTNETRVELDGTEQEVIIDIIDITENASNDYSEKTDPTNLNKVVIMALPGAAKGTTSFEILSAEFSTAEAPDAGIRYNGGQMLDFNSRWRDNGDGKWTTALNEGVWTLSYAAGHSWASVTTKLKLGGEVMNYVYAEVKVPEGKPFILKFADGNEASVTGTGDWQVISKKLSANVTGNVQVLIFADYDGADAGEIQIKTAKLYNVSASEVAEGDLKVTADWKHADKGDNRFTIVAANGKTTITNANPTESNGGGWDSLLIWIDLGEGGYDTLTLTFKGTEGHIAIVKLNNEGTRQKEFSAGQGGALSGADQTVELNASGLSGVVELRLFLDWDGPAGGVFEISNIVFHAAA